MNNYKLGQYLKELRSSFNYSQEFVASHLNITRQTYSHYENGRIIPPANSLFNLAALYGISVENFMELVVTYNINMDFAAKPVQKNKDLNDDLTVFLEFTNACENSRKFKYLDRREKILLYYYLNLDQRDQEDIISFMKVKHKNRAGNKGDAAQSSGNTKVFL